MRKKRSTASIHLLHTHAHEIGFSPRARGYRSAREQALGCHKQKRAADLMRRTLDTNPIRSDPIGSVCVCVHIQTLTCRAFVCVIVFNFWRHLLRAWAPVRMRQRERASAHAQCVRCLCAMCAMLGSVRACDTERCVRTWQQVVQQTRTQRRYRFAAHSRQTSAYTHTHTQLKLIS